jgi:hypothetical protein
VSTFSKHPSHTTKRIIPWKIKKSYLLALKNNQTFPSHATQETTHWITFHPQKHSPIPFFKQKLALEKGGITQSSTPHPKKLKKK